MKKYGLHITIGRCFTNDAATPYELIHFREPEEPVAEGLATTERPSNWGYEAAALFTEQALVKSVPRELRPVEENTLPSWLWKRQGKDYWGTAENSVKKVFDRVAGSTAYAGWKKGLFANEAEAQNFYDEIRYLLTQRIIAIEPSRLAVLGLNWAYGYDEKKSPRLNKVAATPTLAIPNATIDAVLNGNDKVSRDKWLKFVASNRHNKTVAVQFSDIAADWGKASGRFCRGMLDLLAFQRDDGTINIETLCHAVRLLVLFLELEDDQSTELAIGFYNLAPLLMSQALAYDGKAARATAAAVSSIITAEAYATSAQLAGLLGTSAAFKASHNVVLRNLRNHKRAAYGDFSDYEKISVLPAALILEDCPDLALVAAARLRWDEALELVQKQGSRHTQATSLRVSLDLATFVEAMTQGLGPLQALTRDISEDGEVFYRSTTSALSCGLNKLGFSPAECGKISDFIVGAKTLVGGSSLNHQLLRARGFDDDALDKLENYLPYVNDIRLAFTPWVLGHRFCREKLKISETRLKNPGFNLLNHLGFTADEIAAANTFCYGHGHARGAPGLSAKHAAIFACADTISAEAQIRMAASVQSFVSGDVAFSLSSTNAHLQSNEAVLLSAWRSGIKSVTLYFEEDPDERPLQKRAGLNLKSPVGGPLLLAKFPLRKTKPKAGGRLVSLKRGGGQKSSISPRDKRH